MPSVKSIGYTNYSSRPMEKTTSMNKQVAVSQTMGIKLIIIKLGNNKRKKIY